MPDERKEFEKLTIKFGKKLRQRSPRKAGKQSRRPTARSIKKKAVERLPYITDRR